MTGVKYEIDMLSVGAADAILIRLIDPDDQEWVILIDAGYPGDGRKVVDHIKKYYNQQYIDLAICTHPDNDHIGGFDFILDNITIKEFWIHDPRNHVDLSEVKNKIKEHTLAKSLSYITETLDSNVNIIDKIDRLNIPRQEPFDGLKHHSLPIQVLGPTKDFYKELLKRFRDSDLLFHVSENLQKSFLDENDLYESLSKALDAQNDPSAENNSSAVIAFWPNNKKYLFTADAGPFALNSVIERYFDWTKNIDWLDIPHHGSKRSLTSDIINHLTPTIAYVSAESNKRYLSQAVINAFTKVGTKVYSTHERGSLFHPRGIAGREDYTTINPLNKGGLDAKG